MAWRKSCYAVFETSYKTSGETSNRHPHQFTLVIKLPCAGCGLRPDADGATASRRRKIFHAEMTLRMAQSRLSERHRWRWWRVHCAGCSDPPARCHHSMISVSGPGGSALAAETLRGRAGSSAAHAVAQMGDYAPTSCTLISGASDASASACRLHRNPMSQTQQPSRWSGC